MENTKEVEQLLMIAIYRDDIVAIDNIFKTNIDLNFKNFQTNPLIHAASLGKYDSCALILDYDKKHIWVNLQDNFSATAMHHAVQAGSLEICKLLVRRGAFMSIKNIHGETPFFLACRIGKLDIVKHFFNKDIVKNRNFKKQSPFLASVMNNHKDVAEFLLQNNSKDDKDEDDIIPTF